MTEAQTRTSARSRQLDVDAYERDATAAAAPAIAALNTAYSSLTGRVTVLSADVEDGRREVRSLDLDHRTNLKAQLGREALLEELAVDRGLGWTDIARLCRVSVSAVRKWRTGGAITPERLRVVAQLAAFLDLLEESGPVGDPVGWLMMPLLDQYRASGADLYRDAHMADLLEYAQGHLSVEQLLGRWNPDWRDTHRSEWMVVDRPDGERVVTRRA